MSDRLNRKVLMLGFVIVAVLAALLAIAACGRSQASNPAAAAGLEEGKGKRAPDFPITAYQGEEVLGGKEVRFSELFSQGKPVILNFWAGLCPPCRAEMPDFERVYQEYKGKMVLFGLDVGPFVGLGSREDGKRLLQEVKVTYPVGTTSEASVVRSYEVLGMPTTVFIRPDGRIAKRWTGLLGKDQLTKLVEELLASSAKR